MYAPLAIEGKSKNITVENLETRTVSGSANPFYIGPNANINNRTFQIGVNGKQYNDKIVQLSEHSSRTSY